MISYWPMLNDTYFMIVYPICSFKGFQFAFWLLLLHLALPSISAKSLFLIFKIIHSLAMQKQTQLEHTKQATETFQMAVNISLLDKRPLQMLEFQVSFLRFLFTKRMCF